MSPRASLRIAQERAADTRLLDYDEDERGIYILDSARPFTISASHRDIGEQSTGLALYFDTIMHFGLLMLVMFLIVGAAIGDKQHYHAYFLSAALVNIA